MVDREDLERQRLRNFHYVVGTNKSPRRERHDSWCANAVCCLVCTWYLYKGPKEEVSANSKFLRSGIYMTAIPALPSRPYGRDQR